MNEHRVEGWERIRDVFNAARRCAPDGRAELLEELCGTDSRLRAEVEELLAFDDEQDCLIDRSPVGNRVCQALPRDKAKGMARIGCYTIVDVIATGGMGTVYEAVQENPQRTVAVKVMRSGLASADARRRFQYEAEVLARLQHSGIAQIFEAGEHEDGALSVPYFAMEYIPNANPIIKYADKAGLTLRQRMELLAQVCDAVHHGHQHGVIHRDLKPSNILVGIDGRPKVIDFGVACATEADRATRAINTATGQLIGTLQYMSPEQCFADPRKLDTRTDVYSLGVLLYELLCGELPYDVTQTTPHEATRVIQQRPPVRLSTRNSRLRGDAETIVAKALEKEKNRRYGSASELAEDVRRYLAGDAILARPQNAVYQLRVFARRNKVLVGAAVAVLLALTLGIVGFGIGLINANRERIAAKTAQQESEQVLKFLVDTLSAVNTYENRGPNVTLREVLDEAAVQLANDQALAEQPLIRATLHAAIGKTYRSMFHPKAEEHLRAALAIRRRHLSQSDVKVATNMHDLADALLYNKGMSQESESLLRRALDLRKRSLGRDHPDTLESMHRLAWMLAERGKQPNEADALYQAAWEGRRRIFGNEHPTVAAALRDWSVITYNVRGPEHAEAMAREALTLTRHVRSQGHPDIANALRTLATVLEWRGKLDESDPLLREAIEIYRTKYPKEHVLLGHATKELGQLMNSRGKFVDAEALFREAIKVYPDGKELSNVHLCLCESLIGQGRYEEAERWLLTLRDEALRLAKNWQSNEAASQLVKLYEAWEKHDEAAKWRAKLSSFKGSPGKEMAQQ